MILCVERLHDFCVWISYVIFLTLFVEGLRDFLCGELA